MGSSIRHRLPGSREANGVMEAWGVGVWTVVRETCVFHMPRAVTSARTAHTEPTGTEVAELHARGDLAFLLREAGIDTDIDIKKPFPPRRTKPAPSSSSPARRSRA